MKIKVDPDLCIGCGLCAQTCPEALRMEEDKAVVYMASVPKDAEKRCQQAADECPTNAISIES